VADRGGYNQAARRPCRVSSAVKSGVALLEQEVGVPLLRRDGRGVRLTDEGEAVALRILPLGTLNLSLQIIRRVL